MIMYVLREPAAISTTFRCLPHRNLSRSEAINRKRYSLLPDAGRRPQEGDAVSEHPTEKTPSESVHAEEVAGPVEQATAPAGNDVEDESDAEGAEGDERGQEPLEDDRSSGSARTCTTSTRMSARGQRTSP
jgi:hypothetical protein